MEKRQHVQYQYDIIASLLHNKFVYSCYNLNQNTHGVKQVTYGQEKLAWLKNCKIKIGSQGIYRNAVDRIKNFDNDAPG